MTAPSVEFCKLRFNGGSKEWCSSMFRWKAKNQSSLATLQNKIWCNGGKESSDILMSIDMPSPLRFSISIIQDCPVINVTESGKFMKSSKERPLCISNSNATPIGETMSCLPSIYAYPTFAVDDGSEPSLILNLQSKWKKRLLLKLSILHQRMSPWSRFNRESPQRGLDGRFGTLKYPCHSRDGITLNDIRLAHPCPA